MSIRKALAMIVLAVLAPVAAGAEPVFLPGSGVGLEPPPGVTVLTGLNDFKDGRSSIAIVEMPSGDFASLPAFAERLRQLGASDFDVGGAHGLVSRGTSVIGANRLRIWSVLLETEKESVVVSVRIAADEQRVPSEAVEAALRTITFRDADADRMAALPFTVADLAGFRPITLGYPGASLLKDGMLELTRGPITPHPFAPQPVAVIVPRSRVAIPAAACSEYARQALLSNHTIGDVHITAARLFDAGGVQWAEIKAVGAQFTPVNVLFFMRFDAAPAGATSILCTSPLSDITDYSGQFRRLALSVRPKE